MGELNPGLEGKGLELNAREVAILAPLAFLAVCLGVYPECILAYLHETVDALLTSGATP
jgi:NADH:ubiquinone oxidoreductase subunit 4 (subunit M)